MSGGYIKIHRAMLDWEWYHDDRCVRLILHLLLKANYTDKRWKGQALKPGQLITSTVSLAEQLGWSRSAVNRTLDKLKSGHEVETISDNKWTLVTLRKWGQFQVEDSKPDSNRTPNRTATGHQTGQQPDTAKEGEEGKKGKKGRSTPIGVRATLKPNDEIFANANEAPPGFAAPPPPHDRRAEFIAACKVVTDAQPDRLAKDQRQSFVDYWCEASKSGRLRWEGERYFDHGRRMDTWMRIIRERTNGKLPPTPERTAERKDLKITFD